MRLLRLTLDTCKFSNAVNQYGLFFSWKQEMGLLHGFSLISLAFKSDLQTLLLPQGVVLHIVKSEQRPIYTWEYSMVMVELKKQKHTVAGVNLFPDIYSGAGGPAANDKQVSCALRYRLVLGYVMMVCAVWWNRNGCPVLHCFSPLVFHLQICHSFHAPTASTTPWHNTEWISEVRHMKLKM